MEPTSKLATSTIEWCKEQVDIKPASIGLFDSTIRPPPSVNSHFLKGSKLYFPKGSKVETLEDVLAGPETEVMDGIQVNKKDDHPIFPQKFLRFFFAGRY